MRPSVRKYWAWRNLVGGEGSSVINISTQEQADAIIFEAGKKYMFESGKKYDVSLDVDQPNVTIGSYGTGALPELRASEDISTLIWTDNAGVWSATMVEDPKWIYINDTVSKMAETPWIMITGRPSESQITANATTLNAFSNIVGSKLVAKDNPWRTSKECTVTAYSSGTITVTPDLALSANTSLGFKLYNKAEYLTDNNEWAWENGVLYVKSTVSPSTLDIRKSTGDYVIKATAPGLTVETIKINQAYSYGIKIEADNTSVLNCEITNTRGCGVLAIQKYSGLKISYNLVENHANNGIAFGPADSPIIRRNTVRNIGMGLNYGWQNYNYGTYTQVVGTGIASYIDPLSDSDFSDNAIVEYNDISNCAYNGIGLHVQKNSTIRKNKVSNFLNRFSDGAGIYLFYSRTYNELGSGAIIENNFVTEGNNITEAYTGSGFCSGIYMDNRTVGTSILNNTIYSVPNAGINLNWDTKASNMVGNIIYNCATLMRFRRGGASTIVSPDNEENISTGNILIAKNASQILHGALVFEIAPDYNPFLGGSSDNNYYIQPYTTKIGEHEEDFSMTFEELKSRYGTDANSTAKVNYKVTPEDNDIILYTNETDTVTNQLIPAGYEDVDGVDVSGQTLEIPTYGTLVIVKTVATSTYPTWINTQSMVVDAQGEGVEVVDDSLYPIANAFTWELTYRTPSSFKVNQPIKITDDTGLGLVSIATDINGNFYLQLLTNSTNKLIFSQSIGSPVVNTFYHLVVTSTGGVSPVSTMKLNNISVNPNPVETGDYTGLPALTGNCKVQIPNYGNSSYGAGSYNLFRIFNRVLTSAEITTLYNARVNGGLTGLNDLIEACQLELRFEGNANATIGTNGVIQGTPTFATQTP